MIAILPSGARGFSLLFRLVDKSRWDSRAGTPGAGVAGASVASQSHRRLTEAPLRGGSNDKCKSVGNGDGNGESQKRRLAACATGNKSKFSHLAQLASDNTFEVKVREKRAKDPSKFVSVRKRSVN
jgi:hypothetical protein